ncbi:hypothetical protein K505DRAFT_358478 [Melanomma pulvis-pyrius CBS 109.77]|uniref:Uncharacterized protein n=1 Tax=Melanomma pulvis-pyrius CBS 109.77 TaxID=1314802 RepID=A0A6A6XMJ6_9PLEO|nr:hypothetical protein K505DRAFT_358478 [Melanomma pulvis-pyrius CBS 109.77]
MSLVSKSWTNVANEVLYKEVKLTPQNIMRANEAIIGQPGLRKLVKVLYLGRSATPTVDSWFSSVLMCIILALTSAHTLCVENQSLEVLLHQLGSQTLVHTTSIPPNVVVFYSPRPHTASSLLRMHQLRSLKVNFSRYVHYWDADSVNAAFSGCVSKVTDLQLYNTSQFTATLLKTLLKSCPDLTTFVMEQQCTDRYWRGTLRYADIIAALEPVARQLKTVAIGSFSEAIDQNWRVWHIVNSTTLLGTESPTPQVNMGHFTALKHLELPLRAITNPREPNVTDLFTVPPSIEVLSFYHVSHSTLKILVRKKGLLDTVLPQLQQCLPSLKHLHFRVNGGKNLDRIDGSGWLSKYLDNRRRFREDMRIFTVDPSAKGKAAQGFPPEDTEVLEDPRMYKYVLSKIDVPELQERFAEHGVKISFDGVCGEGGEEIAVGMAVGKTRNPEWWTGLWE